MPKRRREVGHPDDASLPVVPASPSAATPRSGLTPSSGSASPSTPASSTPTSTPTPTSVPAPSRPASPGRRRSDHLALGAAGERHAARFLRQQGYRIVDSNVRAGGVELDLVVRRGHALAFVEVKTRRGERLGPPELAVDAAKQARLVRGAGAWLDSHPLPGRVRVRFDVVACRVHDAGGPDERWTIRHLPDAFHAGA